MTSSKASTSIARLRREVLEDLRETSDEQLRQEAAADEDDLDALAEGVRSALSDAVASASAQHRAELQVSCENQHTPAVNNHARAHRSHKLQWGLAVAFGLLGLAVVIPPHGAKFTSETYVTAIGESRTVALPDGSIATLNTSTRMTWIGTDSVRRIEFKRGEALFEVFHDPARPFRISLVGSEIGALGTEFNVYLKADGRVVVTVIDGAVSVREASAVKPARSWVRTLSQNQQMEYAAGEVLTDVHRVEAPAAAAWVKGSIEINGTMREVVNELNRYSARRIVLAPESPLEHFHVMGALQIRDIDKALATLQAAVPGMEVVRRDDTIVLNYPADARPPPRPNNKRGMPK